MSIVDEWLSDEGFASQSDTAERVESDASDEGSDGPGKEHNRERHDDASSLQCKVSLVFDTGKCARTERTMSPSPPT